MEKKSIKKNYIYNLIYQILVMIVPLITTPYLSRVLGALNIGIYGYTCSIVAYFILFGSLGTSLYGQREIAYVQDDIKKRSKVFYEVFFTRIITLFISIILFLLFVFIYGQYKIYFFILTIEVMASMVDISWFFQGLEEFKKTVTRNIIVKFISTILIFVLVKDANDLVYYFFITCLSILLGNISLWFYIKKYITKVELKSLNLKKHLKSIIILFVPQIAIQVYTVLDKTMLGALITDKSEVGYYEQATKVLKLLMTIATSLGTVMLPRIAAIHNKGDKEKIKKYMMNSFSFIMMLTFPFMFGLISISKHFVPVFFGDGFEKVTYIFWIICPIIVIIGLSNVIGTQYFLPTKQQNKYTISVLIGAIVNFTLNLIFIPKFASLGAAIGTVMAETSVTATQLYLVRKEFSIREILKLTSKYFVASLLMFIVSMIIALNINNNFLSIIVQIFVSAIIYFGLLYFLRDKYFCAIINNRKNSKEG